MAAQTFSDFFLAKRKKVSKTIKWPIHVICTTL